MAVQISAVHVPLTRRAAMNTMPGVERTHTNNDMLFMHDRAERNMVFLNSQLNVRKTGRNGKLGDGEFWFIVLTINFKMYQYQKITIAQRHIVNFQFSIVNCFFTNSTTIIASLIGSTEGELKFVSRRAASRSIAVRTSFGNEASFTAV